VYLLDTNICIYIINNRPPKVAEVFADVDIDTIGISTITVAELRYGATKSQLGERNVRALELFLRSLASYVFDDEAARQYALLRSHLEGQGTPIGPLDTLIAAHALGLNAVLVTNNIKEFSRVPDLALENWAEVF
jgi:tRNA(fMet)-specific endonuclease VapC